MLSGIESAKLKLIRAAEHVEAIHKLVGDYAEREPSGITVDSDGTDHLYFSEQPSPRIALLAGEAVYQIRSALDHLAFALVKANLTNILLPNKWESDCHFPLCETIPLKCRNPPIPHDLPVPYKCFEKSLPGIPKQAFAFIESVQPYRGHKSNNALMWLSQLANIDKHRYFHITRPQAHVRRVSQLGNFQQVIIRRLHDGAKIDMVPPRAEMQVQTGFHPFVTFSEASLHPAPANLPISNLLELCRSTVDTLIVPAFEKFIKKP